MLSLLKALDPEHLIETFGVIGVVGIVFAETGLLIGFFLPGDSLLFTAGLLSALGDISFPPLVIGAMAAAVVGDQVGYLFGRRIGVRLFDRPDSRLFKQERVDQTQEFFDKHGPKAVVLARFVPIVRTFTPVLAGVGEMPYRRFVTYNVTGAVLWAGGVTTLGFVLGKRFPHLDQYLLPVILVIIAVSMIPVLIEWRRARAHKSQGSPTKTPS